MYPNKEHPYYGTFVKKSNDLLKRHFEIEKIVMYKQESKLRKLVSYISHYREILKRVKSNDYDYIYIHYVSHNCLPLFFINSDIVKEKVILNFHGSDLIPEKKSQLLFQILVRNIVKKVDNIIVPSSYYKKLINKKYPENNSSIFISPSNGIDRNMFKKQKVLNYEKYNLSCKYKYVGFIGRISFGKGWDDFLRAISNIQMKGNVGDVKFLVVGSGPEIKDLLKLIDELNIKERVILLDSQPQQNLVDLYNILDLFIFPTKREGESLGLVGLEALACGTPVIGSSIGGLKEYIDDKENGFLISPGNYSEISNSIQCFYDMSYEEQLSMSEKSIETAVNYDQEKVSNELMNFLKGLYIK